MPPSKQTHPAQTGRPASCFANRYRGSLPAETTPGYLDRMSRRAHLLVMAKSPVPGRVKTRLCPPCTPEEAASIASAALHDTLTAVAACGVERRILALDGEPGPWIPDGFEVVAQVDGSFDVRLTAAWEAAGGPGLQIGMDTPQVTALLLDECLAALLEGSDPPGAALGAADDGGWWAIGLHRPHPQAFMGVEMSLSTTGLAQANRLRSLGLYVADLPALRDLDTWDDALAITRAESHLATAVAVGAVQHRVGP